MKKPRTSPRCVGVKKIKLDESKVTRFMIAFVWGFALLMGIGWVLNFIYLVGMVGGEIGTMFILRVVGCSLLLWVPSWGGSSNMM